MDLNKCGEGELDVSIVASSGNPVSSEVRLVEAGRLEVVYSPEEAGIHYAEVLFNTEPVPGRRQLHVDCRVVTCAVVWYNSYIISCICLRC